MEEGGEFKARVVLPVKQVLPLTELNDRSRS